MVVAKGEFSLIFKLLIGIFTGALLGMSFGANSESSHVQAIMNVVVSLRHFLGQIIFFLVPLVIVGFTAPTVVRLGKNASRMLFTAVSLAYLSSLVAAFFTMAVGCIVILNLAMGVSVEPLRKLPDIFFQLDIPQLFPVMTALTLAILFGLAATWTHARLFSRIFTELENIMRSLIRVVLIPLLPIFVGLCFLSLAYEGLLSIQLPVFISIVAIVICCQVIWLAFLYGIAAFVSGRNPVEVFRHYLPAYLTAVGTMSSAATLPVSLRCARKSRVLSRTMTDFVVPLGATVHLCGSVIAMTFICMTLHFMLYYTLPPVGTMLIFCVLLAVFAVCAPGVPGGTAVASLGIVTGLLGFDSNGVALVIAVFALQDSFGTACNVTADGALALVMEGIYNRHGETGPMQTADEENVDAAESDANANAFVAPDFARDHQLEAKNLWNDRH